MAIKFNLGCFTESGLEFLIMHNITINQITQILPLEKIDWTSYFFSIALVVSSRADCGRRQFGCIAVSPDKRILSTGYNSPPKGIPSKAQEYLSIHDCWPDRKDFHCCKSPDLPQNSSYESCNAIHSEINCLMEISTHNHYEWIDLYLAGRDGKNGQLIDAGPPCIYCARAICNFNVRNINCLMADSSIKVYLKSELKITL